MDANLNNHGNDLAWYKDQAKQLKSENMRLNEAIQRQYKRIAELEQELEAAVGHIGEPTPAWIPPAIDDLGDEVAP